MTDLDAATQFIAGHARLIDRRRFACFEGDGSTEAAMRALDAYRNDDGGIGHLEPDLRTPASQPSCVLYALEIINEVGASDRTLAIGALDWLASVTHKDGGVPFALPTAKGWPCAPWWTGLSDEPDSSVLMTAGIAAMAHRLGMDHPWLEGATAYCWDHLGNASGSPYAIRYTLDFLDAVPDRERAEAGLDSLRDSVPADGVLGVDAGTEGEQMHLWEFAPRPDHSAASLFDDAVLERELDWLADGQQDDGGWTFSWLAWNPAAALEWRGAVTVMALRTLRAYGRL